MKILKYFRNPKLIILLALSFLVFSCSQYELIKSNKFNFKEFNDFIASGIVFSNVLIDDISDISLKSNSELGIQLNQLQDEINQYYGTDINLSTEQLVFIYSERDLDNIKYYLENQNLMDSADFYLYEDFVINSKTIGFEEAISNYESEIMKRNLNEVEFNNYTIIANTLSIVESQNPDLFRIDPNFKDDYSKNFDPGWRCVLEYVFWIVSVVVTFAACVGPQAIFFCLAAIANLVRQTIRTVEACAGYM